MKPSSLLLFPILALALGAPGAAGAHCDTLDGPVVTAARAALETGRLGPVLAWVQPADEEEIRHAFGSARAVRSGGKEARELADRWFLETLVRVHRAGEGAPFTGLKPAGTPDPAVAAADGLASGRDPKQLEALLVQAVRAGLHGHVARLKAERPPADDVAAGRRWVAAYVPFVHWAEGVHAAAARAEHAGHGAGRAGQEPSGHAGHAGEGAGSAAAVAEPGPHPHH